MVYELNSIIVGDCLNAMKQMDDNSVDLVFTSPPYEDARTYGIDFKLKGGEWVEWCLPRYLECLRVCKGLVAWVVEGKTRKFRYSATPLKLMVALDAAGVHLRKPPVFHRVGIPGSGGPDWLRNDYEFIVCGTKGGKLPWSENAVMGSVPKYAPGGRMSNRHKDGQRANHESHDQQLARRRTETSKLKAFHAGELPEGSKLHTKNDGKGMRTQVYTPPKNANPGNVLKFNVGGGVMGSKLCHENEAPFPEGLAEFFIRSFCPSGGVVLDPFCGSGTTLAVAEKSERQWMGIDIRDSQGELSQRRVSELS
jgi:hypothetical protein